MSETIYDPFSERYRKKPSDEQIKQAYSRIIKEFSQIGTEKALEMLMTVLSYILWSEGIPPAGAKFEETMAALRYGLRNQLESLESASEKQAGKVH
jgi:hypothetical protein